MDLPEIWVMLNSSYMMTKREQVSKDLFCIQSKALSVIEIYSRVEGLDMNMNLCFLLMGKRTKICMYVHVKGAQFLVFFHLRKSCKGRTSWSPSLFLSAITGSHENQVEAALA